MQEQQILGVDVGASGIKGAIIDVRTGELLTERLRFPTPDPSTPDEMAKVFAQIAKEMEWQGPIGCGFPAVIKKGVSYTASNIEKTWIGTDVANLFGRATGGSEVFVLNDADAAGMAEMRFGEGKDKMGTVVLITIGTGLGTVIFLNGKILPNSEFGQIFLKGHQHIAEWYASNSAKKREDLSWETWAKRFDEYLQQMEILLSPDLFILGGGTSKYFDQYKDCFTVPTKIVPAQLLNNAGMVGAAVYAWEQLGNSVA